MRYVSTRGEAPELGFEDVLLTGLARDGGLYVPAHWPQLSAQSLRRLQGASYADVAFAVLHPFVAGAVPDAELHRYPDCGHYILEDAGDELIPLIRTFLDSHPL